MNGSRLFAIFFVCVFIYYCDGITNVDNERNLIGEEERRGVDLTKDSQGGRQAASQKRGLWVVGQANTNPYPSGYDTSGTGYGGYDGSGHGISSSGYGFDVGDAGIYNKRPTFGQGFGQSVGPSWSFGSTGAGFGHSGGGYGGLNNGESHGNDIYKKLALKKLLIPLAGLALLGAAAALSSSNPVLLQLGTISGRKRRSTPQDVYPVNPEVKPNFTN